MKKISVLAVFIACIIMFAYACTTKKDDVCIKTASGMINEPAIFPDSVALGDTIVGQFKITGFSGCSQFQGFFKYPYEDFIIYHQISVPAPMVKDIGCICTEIAPVFEENYNYVPSDTGMYDVIYTIYGDILQHDTVYVY